MIKLENEKGIISIADEFFANIVSASAKKSFGVSAMAHKNVTEGLVSLITGSNKGVKVISDDDGVSVNVHVFIAYGINIPEACKSIVSEIKFSIMQATDLVVRRVDVYVDGVIA